MSERVLEGAAAFGRPRPIMILYGGLTVGVLDMLFAFTYYGLILHVPMLRIFQSVAAGVLGRQAAIDGGIKTFALGLVLHFIVATCIATVYYVASLNLPFLIRYPVVCGLIYGVIAYFGMKLVAAISRIGLRPLPPRQIMIVEIIGHAVLVGLPLGLLASRSAKMRER